MNRADTVGASRDIVLMLDFFTIPTHPDASRFEPDGKIGVIVMIRGRNPDCVTGA